MMPPERIAYHGHLLLLSLLDSRQSCEGHRGILSFSVMCTLGCADRVGAAKYAVNSKSPSHSRPLSSKALSFAWRDQTLLKNRRARFRRARRNLTLDHWKNSPRGARYFACDAAVN
jgi:hypothetical protein